MWRYIPKLLEWSSLRMRESTSRQRWEIRYYLNCTPVSSYNSNLDLRLLSSRTTVFSSQPALSRPLYLSSSHWRGLVRHNSCQNPPAPGSSPSHLFMSIQNPANEQPFSYIRLQRQGQRLTLSLSSAPTMNTGRRIQFSVCLRLFLHLGLSSNFVLAPFYPFALPPPTLHPRHSTFHLPLHRLVITRC